VIVADTGAIIALVDADDKHHRALRALFENDPESWLLPWAVLPEVDYLLSAHVGARAEEAFLADLGAGIYRVEWGKDEDLERAQDLATRHRALRLGLVDGAVIAVAERLGAGAIATLDLRHFGAVSIRGRPRLLPRDLS
jgi:predicted nucleic acid-binding protein